MGVINRLLPRLLPSARIPRTRPPARSARRTARGAATACGTAVLLIGLAYAAIHYNVRHSISLRDPVFQRRYDALDARLRSEQHDLCVLAIGSSRLHNAFMGEVVEQSLRERGGRRAVAYNFSSNGGGVLTSRIYLSRLLERGVRPDRVVVEVFTAALAKQNGLWFEAIAAMNERIAPSEFDLAAGYGLDGAALRRRQRDIEENPWQGLRDQFFERFDRELLPTDSVVKSCRTFDRWGGRHVTARMAWPQFREDRARLMRSVYGPPLAEEELHPGECQALEDLISLCGQHGIGVTLVLMPEAEAFRALYSRQLLDGVHAMLEQASKQHGAAVVDAREWLDEEDFSDGHHVYAHGAAKFTQRLCDEHLASALAGR